MKACKYVKFVQEKRLMIVDLMSRVWILLDLPSADHSAGDATDCHRSPIWPPAPRSVQDHSEINK